MARIARVVVPDLPHHVTQRGNRREPVFFQADDYRLYRRLIATAARRARTAVWAYCLMPNHVHLIVTPADEDGLRATFAEAHRRYTGAINARFQWTGHLFQGRFGAVVMDEPQRAEPRTTRGETAAEGGVEMAYFEYARLSLDAVHCSVTALGYHLSSERTQAKTELEGSSAAAGVRLYIRRLVGLAFLRNIDLAPNSAFAAGRNSPFPRALLHMQERIRRERCNGATRGIRRARTRH